MLLVYIYRAIGCTNYYVSALYCKKYLNFITFDSEKALSRFKDLSFINPSNFFFCGKRLATVSRMAYLLLDIRDYF